MRPRDRMLRTIRGETADRVPLMLQGLRFCSREELNAVDDPLRREIGARILNETAFRVSVPSHTNRLFMTPPQRIRTERTKLSGGCTEVRGSIDTPQGELSFVQRVDPVSNTTWMIQYPVETREDIEKIASVPWELPDGLTPPGCGNLPEDFAQRGFVGTSISSPFVCMAGMMKYETSLELCATDFRLIAELTEECTRRTLDCVKVLLSKPGIEYVWIGGSEWLTPPMGSPALYDALVQEPERSIINYIHENSDAVVHIHCHGRVRDALPKMIERGGDFTEPVEPPPDGDITMAEAKKMSAGRITLGGNIEARILCNETEGVVEEAVRAAFEGGKERFILSTTDGPSPRMSEKEFRNYMRLIDVWEELSPIL